MKRARMRTIMIGAMNDPMRVSNISGAIGARRQTREVAE